MTTEGVKFFLSNIIIFGILRIVETGQFKLTPIPNSNGTEIAYWLPDEGMTWTLIFSGCFDTEIKPSTKYAGKACKQNDYLGGWEQMIALNDLTGIDYSNQTTRVDCDRGDDSKNSSCVDTPSRCQNVEYIGAVRCFNSTRARRATCNSSIPVSYLEVNSGSEWVQVCRSHNFQNTESLCRTLDLDAQNITGKCHTNLTGNRFHGCSSVGVCDECTVKCSVPKQMWCMDPDIPMFGFRRTISDVLSIGATVEYSCQQGYHLQGAHTLECVVQDASGNCSWSADIPMCVLNSKHGSEDTSVDLHPTMMISNCMLKDILLVVIAVTSLITFSSLAYIIFLGWQQSQRKDNKQKYSTPPKATK